MIIVSVIMLNGSHVTVLVLNIARNSVLIQIQRRREKLSREKRKEKEGDRTQVNPVSNQDRSLA